MLQSVFLQESPLAEIESRLTEVQSQQEEERGTAITGHVLYLLSSKSKKRTSIMGLEV